MIACLFRPPAVAVHRLQLAEKEIAGNLATGPGRATIAAIIDVLSACSKLLIAGVELTIDD